MLVIDDRGDDSPDLLKEIDNAETDIVPPLQEKVEAAPKLDIPRPVNISVENDYASQPVVTKQYLGGPIKLSKSTRTKLILKSKTREGQNVVTQSFDPGSLRNLASQNYQTQQNQTQNLSNLREINRSSNVNVSQQMAQQLLKQFKNSNNSYRNGGANHTALYEPGQAHAREANCAESAKAEPVGVVPAGRQQLEFKQQQHLERVQHHPDPHRPQGGRRHDQGPR